MRLIADLHLHTNVSHHAFSSLTEMCAEAHRQGLELVAVTNHGPQLPDGAHQWHFESLHELPRLIESAVVLGGAEVNILDEKGSLDLPQNLLARLDFVIASFHAPTFPHPTPEKCTQALEQVLKNPAVHLLAHLGTPSFAFDYQRIIAKCRQYNKAVELNGSSPGSRPGSIENCRRIAQLCAQYGVPVFINSDAHFSGNLGLSRLAVEIASEAGLPEELVINADPHRLREYLAGCCGLRLEEWQPGRGGLG